jgi:hypothetical protein
MTPPLVSVAMATYNGERFLREQLDTIYEQTWTDLEVVVSDDRSTDGSVEILEEYRSRRGLRYSVSEERLGLVRNFERAISLCRGELVTLSDQDDLWRPERVERLVAGLEPDYSLAYASSRDFIDVDGRLTVDRASASIRDWARHHGSGRVSARLLAENWVVSHGMLFRREVAARALPIPPHQPYHDAWIALVASTLGAGIRFVDEPLTTYRRHPASYTYQELPDGRKRARRLLGSQGFGARWRARCAAEIARIEDAERLALSEETSACARALLRYYRSGRAGRIDLKAAWLGLRLAPLFSTHHPGSGRWRMALKGLVGGPLAALGATAAASTETAEGA